MGVDKLKIIISTYPDFNLNWFLSDDEKMQAKNASLNESENASLSSEKGKQVEDLSLRYEICTQMRKRTEEKNEELNRQIGRLEHENEQLKAQNAQLQGKIEVLEGKPAQGNNTLSNAV